MHQLPVTNDPFFLSALGIHKAFGNAPVLRGVDLRIAAGETVCLLGPSGCGKTTLLRIIAGLEQPDRGRIEVEGRNITDLPAHRRDFGLMFQDFALFPHLNVADNIAFGPRMHGWPADRTRTRVAELLDLIEMPEYGPRKVYELSGGQQQRVALARSLAPQPRLLMLDEPLGSLDRVLREQLLADLRQLLQRLSQTTLYVTHDQLEAFAIADRVILMNEGQIEQDAPPAELYLRPATVFAAHFLGFKNVIPGVVRMTMPTPVLDTPVGELHPHEIPPSARAGDAVQIVIRPEGARPTSDATPGPNRLHLPLTMLSLRGAHTRIRLRAPAALPELEFELPGIYTAAGEQISLTLDPNAIVVIGRSPT